MKKNVKRTLVAFLAIVVITIGFSGCTINDFFGPQEAPSKPLTASQVTSDLQKAKLPVTGVIVYTESSDPNKLMGRPNQYITKTQFGDSRVKQLDPTDPVGGTIETFANKEDLNDRKTYIEGIEKDMPAMTEYIYTNGNYLLRLDKSLTKTQAEQYKTAFMAIK